jgi:hypothetical protein
MSTRRGSNRQALAELERDEQYLPIPLRSLSPAHARTPWHVSYWRRHSIGIMIGCGLASLASAMWLTFTVPPIDVYSDSTDVHIGASLLTERSPSPILGYTLYVGDAALLVQRSAGLTEAAMGAGISGGRQVDGRCVLTRQPAGIDTETCTFAVAGQRLGSHDIFDPVRHEWRRTYSDGMSVEFHVPTTGSLIPIPLPLGR